MFAEGEVAVFQGLGLGSAGPELFAALWRELMNGFPGSVGNQGGYGALNIDHEVAVPEARDAGIELVAAVFSATDRGGEYSAVPSR